MGVFLTVDFAKGYGSLQHSYMEALLEFMEVSQSLCPLRIYLFSVPFLFAVGRSVLPEFKVYPKSGVRQGIRSH